MAESTLKLDVHDGAYPGERVLVLEGVLNAQTAFDFRDRVRTDVPETLVVDMSGVRHIDSSGLGVIIGAYVSFESKSRRLLLAGVSDRIWDIFRTCKVDDVFTRYATVADAEHTVPAVS
jgi:anti-sigma B factor antagonist